MNIFDRENVGKNVWCTVEKDGKTERALVRWIHAIVDNVVTRKIVHAKFVEVSDGWTVKEVGVA